MEKCEVPQPDWSDYGTKETIEAEYEGFTVQIGWTETNTDTILCLPKNDGNYIIHYWNRTGVRAEFANLLTLPVY